ncbi:MAG: GNAT family N-acetyltransferase [Clostridia bacterium]
MVIKKKYNHKIDYEKVNELLYDSFELDKNINWVQPRWEYMHYHSIQNPQECIHYGVWYDNDMLIAIVHHELSLGKAYLEIKSGYEHLKEEMIVHAEDNLYVTNEGNKSLEVYCREFDEETNNILKSKGYERIKMDSPWLIMTKIEPKEVEIPSLPEDYKLKGLDEENDLAKIDRALWRGFNHEGEPDGDLSGRKRMQSAPNYNLYLNVVIKHISSSNYVSYSGSWYDPVNKIGLIEPVATDPDFRKKGLGKIAVLECVKRLGELGAHTVYVESGIPFYQKIGFKPVYKTHVWIKSFS